jgi:hypothetical protein
MRALLVVSLLCVAPLAVPALAQSAAETPAPSPKAKVEQRVGLTDFALEYSSPAVKGRTIWGGLVPYDELWRTGANMATRLTASRDFTFGGKAVPAGSYSLFTIPTKASWTVILNGKPDLAGTNGYDEKNDVVRVTVVPETLGASRERLTFLFSDTTDDAANLDLEWERMRVRVPLKVDTKAQVMAGIDKSLADAWRPHFVASRYLLESGGDLDQALAYANSSIAIKPGWWNTWVKAQILAKQGRKAEAIAAAEESQKLGAGDTNIFPFFKDEIARSLADWKKK